MRSWVAWLRVIIPPSPLRHLRSVHRLIEMINRRVGLSLSRGERVWGRILFCGDGKLGCMVEGDYTALTTSTRPIGQSVHRLIVMIDRRVGLPLREAPLWGSRGERVWRRILFCGDEKLGCMCGEIIPPSQLRQAQCIA